MIVALGQVFGEVVEFAGFVVRFYAAFLAEPFGFFVVVTAFGVDEDPIAFADCVGAFGAVVDGGFAIGGFVGFAQ